MPIAIGYMTCGKGMAPFHAKAKLKQTAQAKILMSPILIQKRAQKIVENAYHQTAYSFKSQTTTIWAMPSILTMFYLPPPPPPVVLLKITNGSVCHRSFFLNTFSLH